MKNLQDPFNIYDTFKKDTKAENFPGTMSQDIQITTWST